MYQSLGNQVVSQFLFLEAKALAIDFVPYHSPREIPKKFLVGIIVCTRNISHEAHLLVGGLSGPQDVSLGVLLPHEETQPTKGKYLLPRNEDGTKLTTLNL